MTMHDIKETRRQALLRLINERFDGNKAAFARAIGRAAPNIHRWVNLDSKDYRGLDEVTARDIETRLGLEAHWLDFDPHSTYSARFMRHPRRHGIVEALAREPDRKEPYLGQIASYEFDEELSDDYVWIDRYSLNLSAGGGELQWVVHEKDPIAFRARFMSGKRLDPANCRALYVRGKSMEPFLMDGDTVLIDTSKTKPEDGEIFAVYFDDQYWIKTINIIPGGLRLTSINPAYSPIDVVGEQLPSVRILGKQVWRGG